MASSRQHLDALTGLRFLAAAHVFAYHVYHLIFEGTEAPPGLHGLFDSGYVGVSFFFVLSGFILGYNYLERPPATREERTSFWVARFARIYPVYLLGLVVGAPGYLKALHDAWPVDPEHARGQAGALVLAPLLLQSWTPWTALAWNGAGWSLAVEAVFYAVFPFVAGRLGRWDARKLAVGAAAAYALSLALPALYVAVDPEGMRGTWSAYNSSPGLLALRFNPLARLPEFLLGILAGRYFLLSAAKSPRARPGVLAVLGVAVAAALLNSTALSFPLLHNGLLAPVFAAIILLLPRSRGPVARALGSRAMKLLGEASYAFYILHMPLLFLWKSVLKRLGFAPTSAGSVLALAAVTLGLSVLAYERLEKPARGWIRAWWTRRDAPPVTSALPPRA